MNDEFISPTEFKMASSYGQIENNAWGRGDMEFHFELSE